ALKRGKRLLGLPTPAPSPRSAPTVPTNLLDGPLLALDPGGSEPLGGAGLVEFQGRAAQLVTANRHSLATDLDGPRWVRLVRWVKRPRFRMRGWQSEGVGRQKSSHGRAPDCLFPRVFTNRWPGCVTKSASAPPTLFQPDVAQR